MSLRVVLASRADDLVPPLVELLGPAPADPFAPDLVVVPNAGVRDWATARLAEHLGAHAAEGGAGARGDGVCANVDFAFPGQFLRAALGIIRPDDDPWDPDALAWRILAVLGPDPDDDLAPGFTAAPSRYGYARRVADLFDRYAVQRPEMVREWARGRAVDGAADATAEPLTSAQRWEHRLWRRLRDDAGPSPAERLLDLRDQLAGGAPAPGLPERLAVLGLGTLSATQVSVLDALADRHHVLVGLVHPAPLQAARLEPVEVLAPPLRRAVEVVGHHPLVRTWGRPAVEAGHLLAALDATPEVVDRADGDHLLARLQRAVLDDRPPTAVRRRDQRDRLLAAGDGSVQVHSCHGPARQVEALRDALLHLFAADDSLRPADVVVVCPDLERFAPLVDPVLGAEVDGQRLPVVVSDRSLATRTPVAAALDALLELAAGRCRVSDLSTTLALEPVARALGLSPDDLVRVGRWGDQLEVRWGLDAEHRQRWGYPPDLVVGTWAEALDRLLAGVAVQSLEPVETAPGLVAWDDLGGDDLDAVGRVADAVAAVGELVERASGERPMVAWCDVLAWALDRLVAVDPADRWQLDEAADLLDRLRHESAGAAHVPVGVGDVRRILRGRLGEVSGRTRLRTGAVTVASVQPLRGVPARVVAVLGLDDDAGGRGGADGDDVLARRPRVGERDPALERRAALLDALMAAGDHLLVTHTGRDVTTNDPVPPSVVLDELLDAVADQVEADQRTGGPSGRLPVVVAHTRQLADPVNLGAADARGPVPTVLDLTSGRPWTYDGAALAAGRALLDAPTGRPSEPTLLAPTPPGEVDLDDLHHALRRAAQVFLRDRLGVGLDRPPESDPESIELWLDPLARSQVGRELLAGRLAGADLERWRHLRPLLGGLPPGALGQAVVDEVDAEVRALLAAWPTTTGAERHVAVDLTVDGTRIRDAVAVDGTTVVVVDYTRFHPRMRTRPWLALAALTATDPATPWTATIVGRATSRSDEVLEVERIAIAGATDDERRAAALSVLALAVDLRRRAQESPIPLFERVSWLLLDAPPGVAAKELEYDLGDPWAGWLHGDLDITALLTTPSTSLEDGLPEAPCRAGRYARALQQRWGASVVPVPLDEPAEVVP